MTTMRGSGKSTTKLGLNSPAIPQQKFASSYRHWSAAILWLLSAEASYVTASILEVTGGR
jgi:NAD(P)-dependent dehydrogenase (short-subunit alcohol dehydrogenase family)